MRIVCGSIYRTRPFKLLFLTSPSGTCICHGCLRCGRRSPRQPDSGSTFNPPRLHGRLCKVKFRKGSGVSFRMEAGGLGRLLHQFTRRPPLGELAGSRTGGPLQKCPAAAQEAFPGPSAPNAPRGLAEASPAPEPPRRLCAISQNGQEETCDDEGQAHQPGARRVSEQPARGPVPEHMQLLQGRAGAPRLAALPWLTVLTVQTPLERQHSTALK